MQTTLGIGGCLSRLVSRSLLTGVVSNKESSAAVDQAKLVTAVSGFPKQKSGYNIDHILKGQIGDDAYFVARHVDDWSVPESLPGLGTTTRTASGSLQNQHPPPSATCRRSDGGSRLASNAAAAASSSPLNAGVATVRVTPTSSTNGHTISAPPLPRGVADVIAVADGVGGWRQYGVDPGQFSHQLMMNCERLVKGGYFVANQPAHLLAQGFREMQDNKEQVIGSSTACVMMLSHSDLKLYTANIGDSGFLVVRQGEVVHRSSEQQHTFNTPFQLSLPPSELASDVLADQPESADRYEFNVENGDVIMLATDGIFDNVPDSLLVDEISSKIASVLANPSCDDDITSGLQQCANSIALIARKLSQDPDFLSPFAQKARANGYFMSGGKEDDITVLLAAVRIT